MNGRCDLATVPGGKDTKAWENEVNVPDAAEEWHLVHSNFTALI